jgi:hypothetical protein
MADALFDEQSPPATPSASTNELFPHLSTKQWSEKNSNGVVRTLHGIRNFSTADQLINSGADTYITASNLPSRKPGPVWPPLFGSCE